MKLFVLPLLLFVSASLSTENANSDYQAIETAVSYYLDGGTNNDFETLKKAFHPDARMISMGNDMMNVNALEFFGSRMKPGPPTDRKTRVVDINMSGNAASARLEIEYDDFMFVDYMSLLKMDGEWKIVSKVYTRVNK
ncbi:MAG: nuclear transport factor 2 family protein [Balneolaceae bacterium]|nr:nuclear transport factor 2 family protein [Balneolaceae bacterium]